MLKNIIKLFYFYLITYYQYYYYYYYPYYSIDIITITILLYTIWYSVKTLQSICCHKLYYIVMYDAE